MPVYWFALSQLVEKNFTRSLLIFFILHVLVYPASNGYNSYMDRDEGSIGGLRQPAQPTRQLLVVTIWMDLLAIGLGWLISPWFTGGVLLYILASRAYSYRGIRLKQYPILGYLTVVLFQGALVFFLVYHGAHAGRSLDVPLWGMICSALLIGGFYPLTQIYQHEADRKDGVKTISLLLGVRGTFWYCGIVYALAFLALAYYFMSSLEIAEFFALATCMLPIPVYFIRWAIAVWKDASQANFERTMRMNGIASAFTNIGFITVLLMH